GQRGNTNMGLIKENYYGINVGLSFNDLWFQRRKFNKLKRYFAHIAAISFVMSACNNDLKDIQNLNKKQLYPTGEADSINVVYTDSAKIKAEMYAVKMLDYAKAKYPFNRFPNGIKVTVYDSNKNKNYIV